MANGLDNLDWSMPHGIGGSPLDNLEINPNRVDDLDVLPEDLVDPGLVDPRPVVPDDWKQVIPRDVTLRAGEDPNLAGAATPIVVEPDIRPRPNDLPEPTAPSPATTGLDEIVRDAPDEVPAPSLSTAQKLGLGATLGGAGIATLYDIFGPTGGSPEGTPPGIPPAESPPGGDFRFDPPFPGPTGRNDPADPAGVGQAMGPGPRPPAGWEEPRIRRLANRAGIPYAQALAMVQAGYDEQNIGHVVDKKSANPDFYQRRQAYGTLRQLGHDQLDQAGRDRQAEVVARAQRQYNPMATLSPEWRDFVMAERLLRDSRNVGASPNDIRQAAEQAKAAMEARLGVMRGFQTTPAQEQAAAQLAVDAQGEIVTEAERYVEDNFAWDNQGVSGFFASDYSPEEQDETVRWLMNTYGPPAGDMTPDRAREIVAGIAAKKRKGGGAVGGARAGFDPSAAAGPGGIP